MGCCRVKGRMGSGGVGGGLLLYGEGVWQWLPVVGAIRDGPPNLPPGMWHISKRRGGGWIAAGTSVSIPDSLFMSVRQFEICRIMDSEMTTCQVCGKHIVYSVFPVRGVLPVQGF